MQKRLIWWMTFGFMLMVGLQANAQFRTYKLRNAEQISDPVEDNFKAKTSLQIGKMMVQVGTRPAKEGELEGLRLRVYSRDGKTMRFESQGMQDSYILNPNFYRTGSPQDPTLILAEVGTEYTWGTHVFSVSDYEVRHLGLIDLGLADDMVATDIRPHLTITTDGESFTFRVKEKDVLRNPGGVAETKYENCDLAYVFMNGQFHLYDLAPRETKVLAPAGLWLRDQAHADGPKLVVMPYGEKVKIQPLEDEFVVDSVREAKGYQIYGRWAPVKYNGKLGYAFTGYTSNIEGPKLFAEGKNGETIPEWAGRAGGGIRGKEVLEEGEVSIIYANGTILDTPEASDQPQKGELHLFRDAYTRDEVYLMMRVFAENALAIAPVTGLPGTIITKMKDGNLMVYTTIPGLKMTLREDVARWRLEFVYGEE